MKVKVLMSVDVATVGAEQGLDRAARLMQERGCGCVVVVDEEERVEGILTDRDVCMAALRTDEPLSQLKVGPSMSVDAFTCGPEDPVSEASATMAQHQVRRLPVIDRTGRLRGLLSLDDVAREAWREEGWIVPWISAESVGKTLGRIDRPHLVD